MIHKSVTPNLPGGPGYVLFDFKLREPKVMQSRHSVFAELLEKEWYKHHSQKGNKNTTWAESGIRLLERNVLNDKTHIYKYLILYKYMQTFSFITLLTIHM